MKKGKGSFPALSPTHTCPEICSSDIPPASVVTMALCCNAASVCACHRHNSDVIACLLMISVADGATVLSCKLSELVNSASPSYRKTIIPNVILNSVIGIGTQLGSLFRWSLATLQPPLFCIDKPYHTCMDESFKNKFIGVSLLFSLYCLWF